MTDASMAARSIPCGPDVSIDADGGLSRNDRWRLAFGKKVDALMAFDGPALLCEDERLLGVSGPYGAALLLWWPCSAGSVAFFTVADRRSGGKGAPMVIAHLARQSGAR